ncbi:MAG: HlyD family type I secretion periplasmic adaptor subunit, partial [Candidatus Accumulibacter sp.]|nr:HlyD family type I secretion periplasmic adaptor subunit [Accumulibacter sp.]
MTLLRNSPAAAPALADSPAPEKKAAVIIAGLFFIVLLGGAAIIPLDSGAIATGTVIVSGRRQAVQHKEGGIVSRLLAQEGRRVRKGDPLLIIASTDIAASERGVTAEVLTLLAQRERLKAERDGLPTMAAPVEYAAMAPRERALAEQALREQRRIFDAKRGSISAQQDVLVQRRRQNREQVVGIDRQMISNREQRRLLEDELRGMRELEKKGFAATNRIRALERNAAALDGEYGAYQARRSEVR